VHFATKTGTRSAKRVRTCTRKRAQHGPASMSAQERLRKRTRACENRNERDTARTPAQKRTRAHENRNERDTGRRACPRKNARAKTNPGTRKPKRARHGPASMSAQERPRKNEPGHAKTSATRPASISAQERTRKTKTDTQTRNGRECARENDTGWRKRPREHACAKTSPNKPSKTSTCPLQRRGRGHVSVTGRAPTFAERAPTSSRSFDTVQRPIPLPRKKQ
jgi:hypothetical protein